MYMLTPTPLKEPDSESLKSHLTSSLWVKYHLKMVQRASNMDQQLNMPAIKPGDLSSIPRTHMVKAEHQLLQGVLWPSHAHHGICLSCPHAHVHKHRINL